MIRGVIIEGSWEDVGTERRMHLTLIRQGFRHTFPEEVKIGPSLKEG